MKRVVITGLSAAGILLIGVAALGGTAASPAPSVSVTFNKDVLPILQKNCQTCHRPGEVAPMSLLTYHDARPWAAAIKTAVLTKQMPPWYADAEFDGHFLNQRKLTPQEISTLKAWVDSGAVEGDAKDKPAPPEFVEGWSIGKPDKILPMPMPYQVPAEGVINYKYVLIPGNFTQDEWVKAAEIRPGNRALVHHVVVFVRPPGSKMMKDAKPGIMYDASEMGGEGGLEGQYLVSFAPGEQPETMGDAAQRIPAGSDIVLQIHYTTNGTSGEDATRIGLIFAKEPPRQQYVTLAAVNPMFAIPPGNPSYEVKAQVTVREPVQLVSLKPHMHLRGKDFEYRVLFPNGQSQTILKVSRYDFNWQLRYKLAKPVDLPKGAQIQCIAHYDNSPNNPANPDPSKTIHWGDQSWEEMMIGFFSVEVSTTEDPRKLVQMGFGSSKPLAE
jgi:hypothetical protein